MIEEKPRARSSVASTRKMITSRNVSVFLHLIFMASSSIEIREHTICVSSSASSQNSSLPRKCQDTVTLEQLQKNTSRYVTSETTILFLSGVHLVNFKGKIVFTNTELTLVGDAATILCNNGSTSFKFESVKKVSMSNLTISNCTSEKNAVIHFSKGEFVTVYNVTILNTKGAGVACVNVNYTEITELEVVSTYTVPPNNTNQFSYQDCPKGSKQVLQIKSSNFTNTNYFSLLDVKNLQRNQSAIQIHSLNCNGTVNISIEGSKFSNSLGSNMDISLNGSLLNHQVNITDSFLNYGSAQRGR